MVADVRVAESGVVRTSYLIYDGNRDEGSIAVGNMKASSPFRTFKYKKGGRYEIGTDVTEKAAVWLAKYQRQLFHIEEEEVQGEKAFVVALSNLLSLYKPILGIESKTDFKPLIDKAFRKARRVIVRKGEEDGAD